MSRLIFHIDVNSAFLSWEATRRVSLGEDDIRLVPSAIGGDREKRTGVILAKSIPAKKFGIKKSSKWGRVLFTKVLAVIITTSHWGISQSQAESG